MPEPNFEPSQSDSNQEKSPEKDEQRETASEIDIQERSTKSIYHEKNEDVTLNFPERKVAGVFDGAGGHEAGDKAAKIARDEVEKLLGESLQEESSLEQAQEAVSQALINANTAIFEQAQAEGTDMITTASVVYIWESADSEERKVIVGNVGDSRVYLFRNDKLEQITLDDSAVRSRLPDEQEAREAQQNLSNTINPTEELTDEELELFRARRILTQSLGGKETVEPRMYVVDILSGDRLLVCSDGIHDNLTDNNQNDPLNMEYFLRVDRSNKHALKSLVEAAELRGRMSDPRSKMDDITAVIIGENGSAFGTPPPEKEST